MKTDMKQLLKIARAIAPTALLLLLVACASTGPAPVEDLSLGSHIRMTNSASAESRHPGQPGASYRVQRGDTLYSIAFRNGLDYRELATWNHISSPYTIYVGQELHVSNAVPAARPSPVAIAAAAPSTRAAPAAASAPSVAKTSITNVPAPAPFETVTAQSASASAPPSEAEPPVIAAGSPPAVLATAPPAAVTHVEPVSAPSPTTPPPSVSTTGEIAWRWPATGPVVGTYLAGDQTRQGIDIAGQSGDPVRAAADGTVVYSGNGLIGYGELIIVKHSPAFLSAYGHNRKRLVKEGDRVTAGQQIAEMGSSSANRDSLHFEIRKNGKPANPTDYLPRR